MHHCTKSVFSSLALNTRQVLLKFSWKDVGNQLDICWSAVDGLYALPARCDHSGSRSSLALQAIHQRTCVGACTS